MAELAIRLADATDFEVISDVYRRSSLSNAGDREVLLANPEALVFAGGSIREGRTRAAVADGRVVGFATMTLGGEVAELDDLFVDPAWMRRGVARALVLDAVSVARAGGSKRIEVTANAHALNFYNAVGFVAGVVVATQFALGTRMHLDVVP
jgi:GNAT superfamily N-acetyltransferase